MVTNHIRLLGSSALALCTTAMLLWWLGANLWQAEPVAYAGGGAGASSLPAEAAVALRPVTPASRTP